MLSLRRENTCKILTAGGAKSLPLKSNPNFARGKETDFAVLASSMILHGGLHLYHDFAILWFSEVLEFVWCSKRGEQAQHSLTEHARKGGHLENNDFCRRGPNLLGPISWYKAHRDPNRARSERKASEK